MYSGVPTTMPVRVRPVPSPARTRPKSMIVAWPSGPTMMLDGLMSRWIMPWPWA